MPPSDRTSISTPSRVCVNVVGLESQPSEIIDLHAKLFKKHGITTIRNFDAMNDVRNLSFSGQCITDAGLNHEVAVALMELPPGAGGDGAHTPEFYTSVLRSILDAGVPFDSVCYKDASGTSVPSKVYESIKQARQLLGDDVHLRLHTHETAGVSVMQYKAALDAGADGIDLCMAPVSGGTAQPDVVAMWHALRGTDYDLGLDIDKVLEASEIFKECMSDYLLPMEAKVVDPWIPVLPDARRGIDRQHADDAGQRPARSLPGRDQGDERCRPPRRVWHVRDPGQSVLLPAGVQQRHFRPLGSGWPKVTARWCWDTSASPRRRPIRRSSAFAEEQLGLPPTTEDPRALNDADTSKGIAAETARLKEAGLPVTDENVFIAASLKEKGLAFLKGNGKVAVRKNVPEAAPASASPTDCYTVRVNERAYDVRLEDGVAVVDGQRYTVDVSEGTATSGVAPASSPRPSSPAATATEVRGRAPRAP